MTNKEIISHRLVNQQIAETNLRAPEELVSYMVAMQAQDFAMAKWAIGLRIPGLKEADIESAFNEGKILRTHMMRPTWHFVTPSDIRWILQLTSPRVQAFNAGYYKKQSLDKNIFRKSNTLLIKSLSDHRYRTKAELKEIFSKAKIDTDDLRLTFILMNAELEGIVCSGPRKGKQFTYALLDEKTPTLRSFQKDEALHELTSRYFKTRGPATVNDFSWWSGLTVKEIREGLSNLGTNYIKEVVNGKEYIFYDNPIKNLAGMQTTFLIPDYDEYGISYKDRSSYIQPKAQEKLSDADFYHAISVDGYFSGSWKRPLKDRKSEVQISPLQSLTKKQLMAVDKAVKKYMEFFS